MACGFGDLVRRDELFVQLLARAQADERDVDVLIRSEARQPD